MKSILIDQPNVSLFDSSFQKKFYVFALITAMAVTGCGGGGGGSESAPSTPIGTAPAAPTPVPPVSYVQPAALQAAVKPDYPAGSALEASFNELNAFRAAQGLGPVNQNASIDVAARNHAEYIRINNSGADPHTQVAGKPGFTGATVQDRVIAAGYAATVSTEVIAFSLQAGNPDASAIDNLVNGLYHRNAMMHQGMTHVGISAEDAASPLLANLAAIKPQVNAGDYVGVYPANNQTGVYLTHSLESPNPFYQEMEMTVANMCTKTSSPVTVASQASTALSVTSFTVTEEGQATPLDARIITKASTPQDGIYLGSNVAHYVAKTPFKPNTKYNVRFIGKATGDATGAANGLSIDKAWTFTTGSYKMFCK
ncbi:CAP domain-containing protein [Massilia sp. LC238]|uniref:CAP domain-containing protein n=1 Tax=Massilia sp. LC238 TaxID=1502852 RepID=UPI0004E29D6F|nr:CAP domain-containing protein [Massilia sp. LC238]KFC61899.1 Allergen V5/TPX-1-like protein [Massilia sp. LC238]